MVLTTIANRVHEASYTYLGCPTVYDDKPPEFYRVFRFPSERLQNLQQQLQMEASFQSAARSWFLQFTAQSCNLNEKCEKLIMNCIWGTLFDASWFRFQQSFLESALAKPRPAVESLKKLQQKRLCWTHWCILVHDIPDFGWLCRSHQLRWKMPGGCEAVRRSGSPECCPDAGVTNSEGMKTWEYLCRNWV